MTQRIYETILEEKSVSLKEYGLTLKKLEALRHTAPTDLVSSFKNSPYLNWLGEENSCEIPLQLQGTSFAELVDLYFSQEGTISRGTMYTDILKITKSIMWIAEIDNHTVGGIWYEPQEALTGILPTHIIVNPEFREYGIGSALEEISCENLRHQNRYKRPLILQICWPINRKETEPAWFKRRGYSIQKSSFIYCAQKSIE